MTLIRIPPSKKKAKPKAGIRAAMNVDIGHVAIITAALFIFTLATMGIWLPYVEQKLSFLVCILSTECGLTCCGGGAP
jgi:hypothetical protein